jgi:hypothetical protein
MRKTIILFSLLLLFSGGTAIAQGGASKGSSGGQDMSGGIPPAPIGHRQPRASDVPNEKNLGDPNDPVNKEDAALDRKIKSICRGC